MNLGVPEIAFSLLPLGVLAAFVYAILKISRSMDRASKALEEIAAAARSKNN